MSNDKAPSLKEIFNKARIAHISSELLAVYPKCDNRKFKNLCLQNLDKLSLMQRLHQVALALQEVLPKDSKEAFKILRALAPRINNGFVTMALGDCVVLFKDADLESAAEALKFLTSFGSSEFAIRHLLARDPKRMLKIMETWTLDTNEHVRRLASEGSRPRLPWAQKITTLLASPPPTSKILKSLMADPSLYVRKSVANHLNDITKSDPDWVLKFIEQSLKESTESLEALWTAKHALRSLIKKGNKRALAIIGVVGNAEVRLTALSVSPKTVRLGDTIELSFKVTSTSNKRQKVVCDYAIHYVKKSGSTSPKVFKLKTFFLEPAETVNIKRVQTIDNFTTRAHYPGTHEIDILANGDCIAKTAFILKL